MYLGNWTVTFADGIQTTSMLPVRSSAPVKAPPDPPLLRLVLAEEAEIVVVDASEGRFDELRDRFPNVRWIPFAPADPRFLTSATSASRRPHRTSWCFT